MSNQSVLLDLPPLTAAIDQNPLQLQGNMDLLTAIRLMDLSSQGKYLLIMTDEIFQGIFTDQDVVKAVATGQDLRHTTLADLLPNQSISLTMDADQTILTALAVLYRHQLAYLPVLTVTGQVLGVVTQTTLLQTLNRIEERTAAVALANAQLEQEIAERRRIEVSLQETTDRYRSIMAALDTGIVFQGTDGGILTCNPSAAKILGMSMASVVESSSFSQHWHPIHEDGSPFPGAEHPSMLPHFLRAQRLEILGTLASGIAHDLNNIFTPILAASQLLPVAIPHLDGRGLRLVKMLEESAHRGSDLVNQILAFAQGSESEHKSIEIIPVLSSVLCVARQTFPGSIEVIEDFADQPLRLVMADSTQIHQVLMNLLVNARDAMPQGGRLKIMARNLDLDANASNVHIDARSGSYVAITVSDSGMGIPRQHLEKIFDPFFTTKGTNQGTGLGLSTVVTILKNHGGFLLVNSEVGQGSDFQVCLPCHD